MKPLRVLSIGAGAVGTFIGGSLALQGHDLVFVEHPRVVEELRSRGLRLTLDGQDHHITEPRVFPSMEAALKLGNFDVALFALKSYDTQTFITSLQSTIPDLQSFPPILCLSNGVDNEPALARILGDQKVIAGTVTSAIGRRAAGDIVCERLRGVGVAAGNPLSERLTAALDAAGLHAQLFPKAADMKWSKLLINLLAGSTSAILDLTPGEVFANPKLYRLEIMQLRETLAVMRAQDIDVVNLPGTPVVLLAFVVRFLPLAVSRPFLKNAVVGGRGGKMPSFHIDLHSGRGKSEVDYLNGAVVRAGQQTGVPTPVNQLLRDTLLKLTAGDLPLDTFSRKPERLLKML